MLILCCAPHWETGVFSVDLVWAVGFVFPNHCLCSLGLSNSHQGRLTLLTRNLLFCEAPFSVSSGSWDMYNKCEARGRSCSPSYHLLLQSLLSLPAGITHCPPGRAWTFFQRKRANTQHEKKETGGINGPSNRKHREVSSLIMLILPVPTLNLTHTRPRRPPG